MTRHPRDASRRHTSSRRTSLLTLGSATLAAAFVSPAIDTAAKAGKKGKERCGKQKEQCRIAVTEYCAMLVDPQLCESVYLPCCEQFTQCNVGAGIACIFRAD
jgi:hypothetical protein